MVLLNDGIKHFSEVLVRVTITSVDTAVLVVELHSTCDCLGQCELGRLGGVGGEFVPYFLGDVLGDQTVLRLDFREWSRHLVFIQQCVHRIDHVLDKFNFTVSQSVFIRDIISVVNMSS